MKDKGQFNQRFTYTCSGCNERNNFEGEKYAGMNTVQMCGHCGKVHWIDMDGKNQRSQMQGNIIDLMSAIQAVFLHIGEPMTARGVFYQLTTLSAIEKTEKGYEQVCRILGQMRWRGWIDWSLIVDESRYFIRSQTFKDKSEALDHWAISYRRALWEDKKVNVQIYVEKLALAGIMRTITEKYDVSLFPMRGFNSLSYTKDIAQQIIESDKHTVLYHFGDYDPSGVCAAETLQNTLSDMGAHNFTFERVAVHPWQISMWNLPTRPTKTSDSRSKGFEGESCELDAIEPPRLRAMVEECILRWIQPEEIERIRAIEQEERNILKAIAMTG